MGTPVLVTKYGLESVIATITFEATDISAQAYAHPIEGTAFGVKVVQSLSEPATVVASPTPNPVASGPATTYTVCDLADLQELF